MSLQDLADGGQKPELRNLSGSGWIEMSATMDSGAAVTAAQIGRESFIGHLPHHSWRQATTGVHFGSLGFHTAQSLAFPAFISGFRCGGVVLLGQRRAHHDVIMRAYHARTDNALVNRVSTQHLDTARELLNLLDESLAETQHARRNMRDGKEPPAPQADASCPPRPGVRLTAVDDDGGDEQPHTRQRMHLQTTITSPCGWGIDGKPSGQRTSVPGARLRLSHTFVVGGDHRLPRGYSRTGGSVTCSDKNR